MRRRRAAPAEAEHFCAARLQAARDGGADAARRAGDDGGLAFQRKGCGLCIAVAAHDGRTKLDVFGRSIWNILCRSIRCIPILPPSRLLCSRSSAGSENVERAVLEIALLDLLPQAPVAAVVVDRLGPIGAEAPVEEVLDLADREQAVEFVALVRRKRRSMSPDSRIGEVACSATTRPNGPSLPRAHRARAARPTPTSRGRRRCRRDAGRRPRRRPRRLRGSGRCPTTPRRRRRRARRPPAGRSRRSAACRTDRSDSCSEFPWSRRVRR